MNNESGRTRDGLEIINKCGVENCACKLQDGGDHSSSTTNPQFITDMWQVLDSAGNLLLSKHKDYGPTNISRSPGGPLNGLRVRMHDKTARINHLIDTGATPENESLRDSFLDLLNYSAIALMVIDGNWPES
jgi:hypothetical protein